MFNHLYQTLAIATILVSIKGSYAANVLIFCIPIYSQMKGPANVGKVLQDQGNNVTIAIPYPMKSKVEGTGLNLLVYSSLDGFNMLKQVDKMVLDGLALEKSSLSLSAEFSKLTKIAVRIILTDERLLKDIKACKPDLMILTSIPSARMLTIIPYKLNISFIFISTMAPSQFSRSPILPTVVPNDFLDFTDQMTFSERITNTFVELASYYFDPFSHDNAVQRYAPEKPYISLHDLQAKALLWIVDHHIVLDYSPPALPNVKHVGHLLTLQPKPLSQEYQEFMDSAKNGAVIVSFGSILKNVPRDTLDRFIKSFQQTKYKFVIRYSTKNFEKSDKILFVDWLPQYDLLRHKNTRLLITHCGTHSIQEALFVGIPMIGFPVMLNQPHNAAMIVRKGFGLRLEIRSFTVQDLVSAITKVIENPEFKAQVQKASEIMQAERVTPVEEAVYWINHVLTFGADHLRSSAQDIPLWKYLGLDLMVVLVVAWHVFVSIFIKILCFCFCSCCRRQVKAKIE